ncbi:MAG: hypothetical protein SLAVMIC_00323 [uncultured marine phage]|uniref:Uncharacterized protein n=1 Tax=uncultured marine phage TaxID=707152 RepID=A0A8D9C8Q9_9VIRU|nr:MAG: hypothetical protein SLAVMIC_00323 [uncultured marine phage]
MDDDVLDKEIEDSKCKFVKKTLKEKLKGFLLIIIIWIPMFYLFERFIMDDGGHIYRSMFYTGAILGYLAYLLFNPIYKKK